MTSYQTSPLPIAVIEEISLEGLEGITLEGLWKRLAIRLNLQLPLNENYCKQIWDFILKHKNIQFYKLPEEREPLRIIDRRELIDPKLGIALEPAECPFTRYKYTPICVGKIRGSCENYDTRTEINIEVIQSMSISEIELKWGRKFIMVASQELRESILIPLSVDGFADIKLQQYCILERIGRSRQMGEITLGKFSLLDIIKEANTFHYHRKHLIKLKLIVKQTYHQKVSDQNIFGSLFHLPRYYIEIKPKSMILTEKIVEILKQKPNCMAEYDEIKLEIGLRDTIKKLFKTIDFQRFVNTDLKVPYRLLYPNASKKEWTLRNKDEEKTIRVIQLIDPNIDVSEMWFKDEEEEDEQGLLEISNNYLNVSIMRQVYNCLEKSKENGLSQMEIVKKLGQNKLNARSIVNNLKRLKLAKSYMKDEGRQRTAKYVVTEHIAKAESEMHQEKTAISNSCTNIKASMCVEDSFIEKPKAHNSFAAGPSTTTNEGNSIVLFDDIENQDEENELDKISIKIIHTDSVPGVKKQKGGIAQLIESKNFDTPNGKFSFRMLKRTNIVLQTVRTNFVIDDVTKLLKIILQEEISLGFKDKICKKSLIRLIGKLAADKYINIILIVLQYESKTKTVMFICDPSVDKNHPIMRSCVEQVKLRFILSTKSTKTRNKNQQPTSSTNLSCKAELVPQQVKDKVVSTDTRIFNYGFCPKFIRMRVFHEFLYYLIYTHHDHETTIYTDDAIEYWKTIQANINFDEIKSEFSTIYSKNIDWKMFIPPLIKHTGFGNGWALMSDVLLRLPLSIFIKIFNISYEVPDLEVILAHPIRKHYLLKYLPTTLRQNLLKSRRYIFSIDEIIRRLCFIGLLQFGPQRLKEKDQVFVYLNKKASLLNTISSEPGYYKITKKEYETLTYEFEKLNEVEKYWHDLWSICLSTRLGKRKALLPGTEVFYELLHIKPSMLETVEPQTVASVIERDNGKIPGDQSGAAGLDSAFFAHLKRNWNWQLIRKKTVICNPSVRNHKLENIKPVPIQFKRLMRENDSLSTAAGNSNKREKRFVTPIPKRALHPRSIRIFRRQMKEGPIRVRRPLYDAVDKKALTLMSKLRVDWSTTEDNILLLCKVGMLYLAPNKTKTVTHTVVRDILHWSLKSINKTSRACQRRIVYMMKNQTIRDNVNLCLEEVRENKVIKKKFGSNFVTELKKKCVTEEKFLNTIAVHYIDLIILLKKYFGKLSYDSNKFDTTRIPDTLNEFYNEFKESTSDFSTQLLYTDPINRYEIDLYTVNLLIHSSMCCTKDKSSWGVQLFDIYKNYPEKLLSEAMKKIRLDQLLSINKSASRNEVDPDKCLPLNAHPYHLSITFQIQLTTKISYEVFEEIYERFTEIINTNFPSGNNINTELTTTDSGTCILLGELLSLNTIKINIETPKRILILDPVKAKEDPIYERISNRFQEIFSVIPKINIDDIEADQNTDNNIDENVNNEIQMETSKDKTKTIKFSDKNQKICYNVHPIENLLKLKDHHFHFFCLLNSIGTNVHPQTFTINDNNICSIDCVLLRNDFLEFILDSIKMKRDIINKLKTCKNNLRIDFIRIKEDNLIDVYHKLIERSDNLRFDDTRKDIGKINDNISHPPLNILDIVKEISEKIFNNDNDINWLKEFWKVDNDNFEENIIPRAIELKDGLSSKEDVTEKMRKLHDFFVVNASKIHINLVKPLNPDNEKLVQFNNNIHVPESILPWDITKNDKIIEKIRENQIWPPFQRNDVDFHKKMVELKFSNIEITTGIDILCFIETKKDLGATINVLLEKFDNNKPLLQKIMNVLQELHFVMKTGVKTITFVYWLYIQPWIINTYHIVRLDKESIEPSTSRVMFFNSNTSKRKGEDLEKTQPAKRTRLNEDAVITETTTSSQDTPKPRNREIIQLRPAPWIRVNGSLNRRVLDRWLGALLLYCVSSPGSSFLQICLKFKYLHPVLVRNLLDILQEIGSVVLNTITKKPVSLFSKYESVKIEPTTDFDSLESIYVEATSRAVVKLSLLIGNKKYKAEFF